MSFKHIHIEETYLGDNEVHTLCGIHFFSVSINDLWFYNNNTMLLDVVYEQEQPHEYLNQVNCNKCLELLPLYEIKLLKE